MGISWNTNFYIDNVCLDELINSYTTSIKTLTDLYLNFENEVNRLESEELWKGESFDTFKKKFEEWKIDHLKKLSELVQLKEFLEEVKATSEVLITQRDNLKNSLEV